MSFNHPKGIEHRGNIVRAVAVLGVAYPSQIMEALRNQTLRRLSNYEFDSLGVEEKESKIREETMSERAMYNGLYRLTKEGTLNHSNSQYSLSDEIKSDIRNYPYLLGDSMISALMLLHRPTVDSLEHNVRKLVESLGFCFLWCFIYGARPIHSKLLSADARDDLVVNWIQNSINPLNTYEYFLAAIQNQVFSNIKLQKENAKYSKLFNKYQKGLISEMKVSPPSTDYFYIKNLKARSKKIGSKVKKSKYELPDDRLDKIQGILRLMYPDYYKALMHSFIPLSFNPKQKLLRN